MAYGNLGSAYQWLEDFSKAIEYHMQHLAIAKEVGDRAGEKGERASLREGGRKRKKREAKAGGETMHFQTGRMMSSQPQI